MLEVHENEIALRKFSGGTAQLRTLEGTLIHGPLPPLATPMYVRCV